MIVYQFFHNGQHRGVYDISEIPEGVEYTTSEVPEIEDVVISEPPTTIEHIEDLINQLKQYNESKI